MISIPPTNLTAEELMRYAQMQIDNDDPLPAPWAEALINRIADIVDAINN